MVNIMVITTAAYWVLALAIDQDYHNGYAHRLQIRSVVLPGSKTLSKSQARKWYFKRFGSYVS